MHSKRWLKEVLAASGTLRAASKLRPPALAILIYHSVMDRPEQHNAAFGGMIHSTDVFTRQMEIIARQYKPVSLDDVFESSQGRKQLPKRAVAVTFDDGYTDNCEIAAPVLNRFGIPAAFYVVVNSIASGKPPWPIRVRHALLNARALTWTDATGRQWGLNGEQQRHEAFVAACAECGRRAGRWQEEIVAAIEQQLDSFPYAADQHLMMNWEQVRTIRNQGHVVGSHTLTHPNIAHVTEFEAQQELSESKRVLEEQLSQPVWHFSYPNPALHPHWTNQTSSIIRQAGYRTAVTATQGLVRQEDSPLQLRRVLPTKQVDGLRWNLERAFAGYM